MSSPLDVVREYIPPLPDNPHPLGRHVVHDERSRAFRMAAPPVPLVDKLWTVRITSLNQGNLSSCTGNAGAHRLATDDETQSGVSIITTNEPLDEPYAVALYSAATQVDSWANTAYPPDDTGSSGLAIAKVLKSRGLVDVYSHCFSLDDVLQALQHGPVMMGTNWYASMFNPDARGLVTINGAVAGGHEYLAIGIDASQREIICMNSWGPGWSVNGTFRMSWDTLMRLLAEDGDAMVFHVVLNTVPILPTPVAGNGGATFPLSSTAAAALHKSAVKKNMSDNARLDQLVRSVLHVKGP